MSTAPDANHIPDFDEHFDIEIKDCPLELVEAIAAALASPVYGGERDASGLSIKYGSIRHEYADTALPRPEFKWRQELLTRLAPAFTVQS